MISRRKSSSATLGTPADHDMNGSSDSASAQIGTALPHGATIKRVSAIERAAEAEITALRTIVEGTARSTGDAFFQSLVRHLAEAMGVSYAFVAEFAREPTRVRTLAYWGQGRIKDNVEFDLEGTPCEDV